MSNLVDFGGRLRPGDIVVTFALTAEAYNDLLGIVDSKKEERGRYSVSFTMADGSTETKKIKTQNLIKIYDCQLCGALHVEWRCSRCHMAGG